MQPLHPDPAEFVDANLRRAYRAAPPAALPPHLALLVARFAAKPPPEPRRAELRSTRDRQRSASAH